MRIGSALATGVIVLGSLFHSAASHGADKNECVASYEQAQILRDKGKLRGAREQLLVCSQPSCPAFIKSDCTQWLSDVDADTPTIVISARDKSGHEVTSVRVTADGAPFLESLDGKAMPLDPGPHVFRFERGSEKPFEQKYVIHQGERNRAITVQLGGRAEIVPTESPATSESAGRAVWGWPMAAMGIAGLGSFAYFGYSGHADIQHMRSRCAPGCPEADVAAAQRKLIVADVSLGVGVVSLGVATWLFLSKGARSTPPPAASSVRSSRMPRIDVEPLPRGVVAGLTVSFE